MINPQVFRKAAELLRQKGRTRGIYQDRLGRLCLVGAIRLAKYGFVPTVDEIFSDINHFGAEKELAVLVSVIGFGPTIFNDNPDTTDKEILALLETCAALEQAKLNQPEMAEA